MLTYLSVEANIIRYHILRVDSPPTMRKLCPNHFYTNYHIISKKAMC